MKIFLLLVVLLLASCSEEVVQPKEEFIIIARVDSTCPMKMRCVFYDTVYVK